MLYFKFQTKVDYKTVKLKTLPTSLYLINAKIKTGHKGTTQLSSHFLEVVPNTLPYSSAPSFNIFKQKKNPCAKYFQCC